MAPDQTTPHRVGAALLEDITKHSLDEDYAHVAARDRTGSTQGRMRPGLAALVMTGLFGLLATTAAVQTQRNAGEAQSSRDSIVTQIQARSAAVDSRRARVATLREEIDSLRSLSLETTAQGRALSARLDRLGVLTGSVAVRGPGVRVVVDDAEGATRDEQRVLDEDLRKLVNALWAAGAEAIAINGQRLTTLSAIRFAGSAITVNNQVSLARPYTVVALGNPDTMPARFVETTHGRAWLDLRSLYGLQFEMTTERSMRVPAARRLNLRNASTPGEKS
jgi:uncharacterized protein YlxW (UPF0749 family)